MRSFIAVPLSDEIRKEIEIFYQEIGFIKGVKEVPMKNLHITLDFLGDITEKEAERFGKKLDIVASNITPFDLMLQSSGAFPNISNPKILWLGMSNSNQLVSLASQVRCAVDSMDAKKFSPHLTVGRVKYYKEGQKEYFDRFFQKGNRSFGRLYVDRFQLMKSDLSGKTPVYTLWREFRLTGGIK